MAKIDLHVHSKHSDHPSEWFLQRIGASESYTEPEFIFRTARERGMDLVAITDHNTIDGALALRARHPEQVLVGVEVTTYFPEDGCKVHVLVYGLDEEQFAHIQRLRENIYQLRSYLRDQQLACAVAHATYAVNGKLTVDHLEKLMLLFNTFEGINGARHKAGNLVWVRALGALTPERISRLAARHQIEPWGNTPWQKALIGGSDDHAGLFLGLTYTIADADTPAAVAACIRDGQVLPGGRHNDYHYLAYAIYKIAYEFSRHKKGKLAATLLDRLTEFVFEDKELDLRGRLQYHRLKSLEQRSDHHLYGLLAELVDSIRGHADLPVDKKLDLLHGTIVDITDEFTRVCFRNLEQDLATGNIINLVSSISSALPGIFLSVPFFSTLKHMADNRVLLDNLEQRHLPSPLADRKRVVWFTDTYTDLNGISASLQTLTRQAAERDRDLVLATCLKPDAGPAATLAGVHNLPGIYSFKLPGYEHLTLSVPSLLKTLEFVYRTEPDEIFLSTPGPVGLAGLLAARLLSIPCVSVFHTDFTRQAEQLIGDQLIMDLLETGMRWFYTAADRISVPTREYVSLLTDRGYPRHKMELFPRGIDTERFSPRPAERPAWERQHRVLPGINLLYAGRVSRDKGLDFLVTIYRRLQEQRPALNLIIAGDGPYLEELRARTADLERIFLIGPVTNADMPVVYSSADLLVFPSTTDTFGMVVLEAQACGLPAMVSDQGGPQEVVASGQTGWVVKANDLPCWLLVLKHALDQIELHPEEYYKIKIEARQRVITHYTWDRVFEYVFGTATVACPAVAPAAAADRPEMVTV